MHLTNGRLSKRKLLKYVLIATLTLLLLLTASNLLLNLTLKSKLIQRNIERIEFVVAAEPTLRACVNENQPLRCAGIYRKLYQNLDEAPAVYINLVFALEELLDSTLLPGNKTLHDYLVSKSSVNELPSTMLKYVHANDVDGKAFKKYLEAQLTVAKNEALRYVQH